MSLHESACNSLAKGIVSNLMNRVIRRVDDDWLDYGRVRRERSLPPLLQVQQVPRHELIQRSTTYGCLPQVEAVKWPTSVHFTSDLGLRKISELIHKTWNYGSLRYSVNFLCVVALLKCDRHKYVVTWKGRYGSSANVFFNVDVSRDLWRPVAVSYSFGNNGKVIRTPMHSSIYPNEWLGSLEAHDLANHRYHHLTGKSMPFAVK